jgi:hypothetical protein
VSAPISEATREQLGKIVILLQSANDDCDRPWALECGCESCIPRIVDAIVSALIAEGWQAPQRWDGTTRFTAHSGRAPNGDPDTIVPAPAAHKTRPAAPAESHGANTESNNERE